MSDELMELPEGWVWAITEQLAASKDNAICAGPFGTIFKAKDFRDSGIPIIFLRHVGEGKYLTHKPGFMDVEKWEDIFKPYSVFGGELLITKLGEPPGVCAIYPENIGPAMVTPDVIKMTVNKDITEPKYLMYYFNSEGARRSAFGIAYGVTRLRMNLPIFRNLPIPLAPIAEQKRIVAKIEELRSKTQKTREALEAIPEMCDRFRQSVLAAAFRGDLTADWREENSDVEPAEVLLEKIGEELSKQKGKKVDDKLPDPFDIANSWKWVSLSEICHSITDGDHQPPPKSETGIPFLTISNISSGKFNFDNIRYVPESYYEKIQEHRKAKKGDILYSVVGSYGIPVLVDFEDRFCFQRHIAILKPHNLIDSKYLLYALKADFVFKQATEVATGTTQLTVTLSGLRKIRIPLIPKVEQRLIIERLEKVLSGIDLIQQQYEAAKAQLERLNRAVLAKAFRGELVPQDPNDEPALVLLERIREERSKVSDRKSTKRKR